MKTVRVDLGRGDDAQRDPRRCRDDGVVEPFALGRLDLLGVVQEGKRANAVSAQRPVVEQHAGDDEGAGERAAARLVRARDEADAEPTVVSKQALAGRERHVPEDSPGTGTGAAWPLTAAARSRRRAGRSAPRPSRARCPGRGRRGTSRTRPSPCEPRR